MKVSDILAKKGPEVFTVGEDKLLMDASHILVNNKIGVLLVLNNGGKIVGVISERDLVRVANQYPDSWHDQLVKEHMTQKVIVCESEDEIDYVESIMTNNKIRHLPVLNKKVLVGLISIGDIVKAQLGKTRTENKYMMDYISGQFK